MMIPPLSPSYTFYTQVLLIIINTADPKDIH